MHAFLQATFPCYNTGMDAFSLAQTNIYTVGSE